MIQILLLMVTIHWANIDWTIKDSEGLKTGPGNNVFDGRGVWVAEDGLHLKVVSAEGKLLCAEIIANRSLGYGTYRFTVSPVSMRLDSSIVLGMFTWSNSPQFAHREIDVELSRWGDPENENAQFVLQPYGDPRMQRFAIIAGTSPVTLSFKWEPGRVSFRAEREGVVVKEFAVDGNVPQPGDETPRINIWLMKPSLGNDGATEAVIQNFEFLPLTPRRP